MPDDTTTTDDDQRIPQSDESCECGRPLPCVSAFPVHGGTQYISCPCGIEYATKWPNVRGKVPSTPAELTPGEWTPTNAGRDPYPPHAAPWLDECDCDECAEPTHLEEAHMRATDHYSDTEDDMADDDTTIDDPEAYLEERYGVEPVPHHPDSAEDDVLHTWAVGIGLLQIQVNRHNRRGTWSWSVTETEPGDWRDMESADGQADTLPAAARAADDAARDLLAETAERLEGCDGGADFADVADRAEQYAAEMQVDPDLLGYLDRRYPDAYPVPPADRFSAMNVAYEVPAGLGAVRFAEQDGLLMWRRVAVDETPGYHTESDWTAVEGLAPVCEAAEEQVCALEEST